MDTSAAPDLCDITDQSREVSWSRAIFEGLSPSGGLYLPKHIKPLPTAFFQRLKTMSLPEIATAVLFHLAPNLLPQPTLAAIMEEALSFPTPVIELSEKVGCLELFHGPSLAFKDVGARCMAGIMTALKQNECFDSKQPLTILSATSGDTGGAVAQAFFNRLGFRVVILYPAGKVSSIQESQFTTLGANVCALRVAGNFDDCQQLVKQAFLDSELRKLCPLSSANSINIARLLPQTCYYFEAYKQMARSGETLHVAVPSGNFGNIVAGLIAKLLGLPLGRLIAGLNANCVFGNYLESGNFEPKESIATIANAMDVGNPNNFRRLLHLCKNSFEEVRQHFSAFSYSDVETSNAMQQLYLKYNYICDPHGAIGYQALEDYLQRHTGRGFFLHTAHPAKFQEAVTPIVGSALRIPLALQTALEKKPDFTNVSTDYQSFRSFLLSLP